MSKTTLEVFFQVTWFLSHAVLVFVQAAQTSLQQQLKDKHLSLTQLQQTCSDLTADMYMLEKLLDTQQTAICTLQRQASAVHKLILPCMPRAHPNICRVQVLL